VNDPKLQAQVKFPDPQPLMNGIDVIGRCATDPPLIVAGLVEAVRECASEGSRVAELGFGSGWLLEALSEELPAIDLLGLDMSQALAGDAMDKYRGRIDILLGDMERMPIREALFDVIVTCWTLYFMRDIDAALAEFVRCLKPSGRLVVGASAPDHEIEAIGLVEAAVEAALGHKSDEPDVGRRFDLETGRSYLQRRFRKDRAATLARRDGS